VLFLCGAQLFLRSSGLGACAIFGAGTGGLLLVLLTSSLLLSDKKGYKGKGKGYTAISASEGS